MGDPSCRKGPHSAPILTQLPSGQAQHLPTTAYVVRSQEEYLSQKADLELGSRENPKSFMERGILLIPLYEHSGL